ncbi:SCO3374 family protein [Streptomyces sp. NPDC029041]|uniref:SCO3374 family protein n=1 Tax=Streptomyces sp. NPDC029041 TaxID=3155727 RepID=UPI0033E3C32D
MFGAPRPVTASASPVLPLPRRPPESAVHAASGPGTSRSTSGQVRRWYEDGLGWPTAPGDPLRLVVGVRYDVLDVPGEVGHAALRHSAPGSPVALRGDRMLLWVAAGSAEELPGLLEWLDWGDLPLDLVAIGAGGLMEAPSPPGPHGERAVPSSCASHAAAPCGAGVPPAPPGRVGSQGAAVWLRPPEPGCEVEASLPTLSAPGGAGDAPDLARLVNAVATQCHRVRLRRACAQPPAMPAQGR